MKRRLSDSLAAALFLICASCATIPFKPAEAIPTRPATTTELVAGLWTSGSGGLLIRQSGLFEFQGMRMPVEGVLSLDRSQKSARLVGMNDMGVKLFDLSIDRTSCVQNFVMPELATYPGFADAVAISVRRIFISPEPAASDLLTTTAEQYRLTRSNENGTTDFIIGGNDVQLLEKSFRSTTEQWRVGYYEYHLTGQGPFPAGIVLDDDMAGYRLTLWIEQVEKYDE